MTTSEDVLVFQPMQAPSSSLTGKLVKLHLIIRLRYPDVDRVALALYDPETDLLKSFVSSNTDDDPLKLYAAKLADVPSLKALAQSRKTRVIHSIDTALGNTSEHSQWLKSHHYRSSYTIPIYQNAVLAGFLFFDSRQENAFLPEVCQFLDAFGDLAAQLYLLELRAVRSMIGTVHVASGLALIRDTETGYHLTRLAIYARHIGQQLAASHQLSDEFIEYLHLFAPLHDIGKVGIPDRVLLKPGKLDDDEWALMKQHVEIGEGLVNQMAVDLGLEEGLATQMMRNIVAGHHERGDGSGYPRGLCFPDIALEARIVAVADVFDALSCRRAYKTPWPPEKVEATLREEAAQGKLDADCVDALFADPDFLRRTLEKFVD